MKVKEFWHFLCEELDYRFFAGVPCKGFKPLYDTMSSKFLHYIPAVKEDVALALTSGASVAGTKSVVIIELDRIYNLMDGLSSFSGEYKIPVLILAYDGTDNINSKRISGAAKVPYRVVSNVKRDIRYLTNQIDKKQMPAVAIIKEGTLI